MPGPEERRGRQEEREGEEEKKGEGMEERVAYCKEA